jgi:glycosyltransferase involved in cell wall biosynthesis
VDVPGAPSEAKELSHNPGELLPVVRDTDPDIVLTIQWPLAAALDGLHVPLVIDLYGPLMLESLYFSSVHWENLVAKKTRALYLGDFFLCGSQRQLAYFLPWLLHAGVHLDRAPVHIAPLTLPPTRCSIEPSGDDEPHFVAAGIFWPWQDPSQALMMLLSALDGMGQGRLTIIGGPHPQWKQGVFPGEAPKWPAELLNHPRVAHVDLLPWFELNDLMSTAHIGVDLSLPNLERFLAAPTRVYHYLWCGLPVLLSDYLELAPTITAAGAGWAVDPTDDRNVRQAVLQAVESRSAWSDMSSKATTLVSDWDTEPKALYDFCRTPVVRGKTPSFDQRVVAELVKVYKGLGNAEAELQHLQKNVQDRDGWLSEANVRLAKAEANLVETEEEARVLAARLRDAEERLAKVRRSFPYRIYRSFQVLVKGPDESRSLSQPTVSRPMRDWLLLLRLTEIGISHLFVQGAKKWRDALWQKARAVRA